MTGSGNSVVFQRSDGTSQRRDYTQTSVNDSATSASADTWLTQPRLPSVLSHGEAA